MKCENCTKSKVEMTMVDKETGIVYRRRKCIKCGSIFHTEEKSTSNAKVQFNRILQERRKK